MNIQLIQGQFSPDDAIDIITRMVHIKIKYHENKINNESNEEDIKTRETKIKRLQKELFELRKTVHSKTNSVKVEAFINIELE